MPHYYFHRLGPDRHAHDEQGRNLDGDVEARLEAIASIRQIVSDGIAHNEVINLCSRIVITDASGAILHSIRFADAYAPRQ